MTLFLILTIQVDLVPKLTLTLSVRNGPNLQSYLFQAYISLKLFRVEQNCTIWLQKMTKIIHCTKKCQPKTKNQLWELIFNDSWTRFGTYPDFETITTFQLMSRFRNISWFWDNYSNSYQCQFSRIYPLT